jgi:hypothetical protein
MRSISCRPFSSALNEMVERLRASSWRRLKVLSSVRPAAIFEGQQVSMMAEAFFRARSCQILALSRVGAQRANPESQSRR